MLYLKIYKDFETSDRAGAGEMFQISRIEDGDENDLSDKVDLCIHFHDDDKLKNYLSEVFNVSIDEIDLDFE